MVLATGGVWWGIPSAPVVSIDFDFSLDGPAAGHCGVNFGSSVIWQFFFVFWPCTFPFAPGFIIDICIFISPRLLSLPVN